jgi:hypothetical protein
MMSLTDSNQSAFVSVPLLARRAALAAGDQPPRELIAAEASHALMSRDKPLLSDGDVLGRVMSPLACLASA